MPGPLHFAFGVRNAHTNASAGVTERAVLLRPVEEGGTAELRGFAGAESLGDRMFLEERYEGVDVSRTLAVAANSGEPSAADAPAGKADGAHFARRQKWGNRPAGEDGDADPRSHHFENRLGEGDVGYLARSNAGGNEDFLKNSALLRRDGVKKKMLIGKVFRTEEFVGGQRMIGVENNDEFVVEERVVFEALVLAGICNDADVNLAVEQGRERMMCRFDDDVHVSAGERLLEELEASWQPVVARVAFGADAERRKAGGDRTKFFFSGFQLLEDGTRAIEQAAAGRGQEHFLVDAIEEASAEFFFGGVELMTESRLSEMELPSGCGDATFIDNGVEKTEVFGIERHRKR